MGGDLMHLFIIGAPASGKMTIGQELSRLTNATLFYNHQAIDFALEIYQDYTEENVGNLFVESPFHSLEQVQEISDQ